MTSNGSPAGLEEQSVALAIWRLPWRRKSLTDRVELPLDIYQVLEEEFISLHGPLDKEDDIMLPDSRVGTEPYRLVRAKRDWWFHRGHIKSPITLVDKLLEPNPRHRAAPMPVTPAAGAEPEASSKVAEEPPRPQQQTLREYLSQTIPQEMLQRVIDDVSPFRGNLNALFDVAQRPPARESQADQNVREQVGVADRSPEPPAESSRARRESAMVRDHAAIVQRAGTGRTPQQIEDARGALGTLEDRLNTLLAAESLYSVERFTHVTISGHLSVLVDAAPRLCGVDLIRLNRLLLEAAFPDEFEKVHDVRLAAIQERFHRLENHAALCLSGGGIRSATFALGLLQGLARRKLLKEFDYLSTVSGGGYIGSWLTAWLHRDPEGLAGVTRRLANCPPASRIDPDPTPLLHLRSYSNFITPKTGLLTADTWAFIAIYLRNLLLNWSVLMPLLFGCLLLPRVYASAILAPEATLLGVEIRHYLLALGALLSIAAVTYAGLSRPHVTEQLRARSPFWSKRTGQRGFLKYCLLPLTGAAILLTIYWAWSLDVPRGDPIKWWVYLVFGWAVTSSGWFLSSLLLHRFTWSRLREISLIEVVVLMIAGVLGGLLFSLTELLRHKYEPVVRTVTTSWRTWGTEFYTVLAVPAFLGVFLLAMTLYIGLTSHRKEFSDEDREWWARANAWILVVSIAWLVFAGLVIFGPLALIYSPTLIGSLAGLSGLTALLAGRSAKTAAAGEQAAQKGLMASLADIGLPLLATTFLAVAAAAIALLTSGIIYAIGSWTLAPDVPTWFRLQNALFTTGPADQAPGVVMTKEHFRFLHMWAVHYPALWFAALLTALAIGTGLTTARLINLNRFSLHAGYRDRLIRAFLGASRRQGERRPNPFTGFDPADNIQMHELRPALFHEGDFENLGLLAIKLRDEKDPVSRYLWDRRIHDDTKAEIDSYSPDALPSQALKVALIEDLNRALEDQEQPLYQEQAFRSLLDSDPETAKLKEWLERQPRSDYGILVNRRLLQTCYAEIRKKYPPAHRLLHVVNMALNLVGGDNLAWQQRRAEPFSVTPLHCGCFRLGYRRARDYGGDDGISIGTAVAISGAAASSNMGYYTTSPVLSMMLTLFNVRLGWWLGNPGPAGAISCRRQSPKTAIAPFLAEAFGLTDDKNKYVYLSDGGHFENLALYEMVLRRCKIIVVSDAGADEHYELNDLGNAIRKIRIDLGVPIEFVDVPIWSNKPETSHTHPEPGAQGLYWAVGQICYSCVDTGAEDGVLLYIKPAVYGHEPQDVLHYKRSHPAFPHETTADQFFDEPQFESYRALGSYVIDQMPTTKEAASTLRDLVAGVYQQGRGDKKTCSWPKINATWLNKS